MTKLFQSASERTLVLGVGLLTFALCMLVYAGHLHTADETSFWVAAVNIVDRGEFHTNQLGWGQWAIRPGEEQGTVVASGDVYSKKSLPVIVLLTPLVALARLFSLDTIRAVLLSGPIFTAMSAVWLYRLSRALGYPRSAAVLATMTFGAGTMALVYSRLAMGEAIAGWGLLCAVFALHRILEPSYPSRARVGHILACGAGLALVIGTNAVYVCLVPLFVVVLVIARRRLAWRQAARDLGLLTVPIAAVGVVLAGYNYVRFGSVWNAGRSFLPGQEGFTSPLWWGAAGMLVSPARGLVWYSPPVWLALWGWRRFHRTHAALSWTLLATIVMHLVAFGMWWEWWGGYSWGPRYLLPIVPCLILVALPVFQTACASARSIGVTLARAGVGALLAAGIVVQVAGVVVDFNLYETELDAQFPAPTDSAFLYLHDPALVYDVARSPILVHLKRLTTTEPDLAWWPHAQAPLAIPEIVAAIRAQQREGDVIVYLAPELLGPLVNARGLPPIYGLPVNVAPTDAQAQRLFERALREAERVWLITWYGSGDARNWYEVHLRQTWASLGEETLDGYRVIWLARPPEIALQPADCTFGSIELADQGLAFHGDTLFVELHWRAREPLTQDYVTFVHLLNRDGMFVTGQDRQPVGGYRPTSTWTVGEEIIDRFAFPLAQAPPDEIRVEIGWYAWPSIERLPLTDATGRRIEDDRLLLVLRP